MTKNNVIIFLVFALFSMALMIFVYEYRFVSEEISQEEIQSEEK